MALDVTGSKKLSASDVVNDIIEAVKGKRKTFVGDSPTCLSPPQTTGASAKHRPRSLRTDRRQNACLTSTICASRPRRMGRASTSSLSIRGSTVRYWAAALETDGQSETRSRGDLSHNRARCVALTG